MARSEAWEKLITAICEREAQIHKQLLDGRTIRALLEKLASRSRATDSGIGPLFQRDLVESFNEVTGGHDPDEASQPLLMRLPGLTTRNSLDGSREFLDENLLAALCSGRVSSFVTDPYSDPNADKWKHGLAPLGLSMVASSVQAEENAVVRIAVAAVEAMNRWNAATLSLDLVQSAVQLADADGQPDPDFSSLTISGADANSIDWSNCKPQNLTLRDCYVREFAVPTQPVSGLKMQGCFVDRAFGLTDKNRPTWMVDCEVEHFDPVQSNADIMRDSSLALPIRVLLTVLRKLCVQKGSGRKQNALSRGLPPEAQRFVGDILNLLQRHKVVYTSSARGSSVCYAFPDAEKRAHEILENVRQSTDPLVADASALER